MVLRLPHLVGRLIAQPIATIKTTTQIAYAHAKRAGLVSTHFQTILFG